MPNTHEPDTTLLETMIDAYGLDEVLVAISQVCGEKAEYVAINWQDVNLAKRWAKAAYFVTDAAFSCKIMGIR